MRVSSAHVVSTCVLGRGRVEEVPMSEQVARLPNVRSNIFVFTCWTLRDFLFVVVGVLVLSARRVLQGPQTGGAETGVFWGRDAAPLWWVLGGGLRLKERVGLQKAELECPHPGFPSFCVALSVKKKNKKKTCVFFAWCSRRAGFKRTRDTWVELVLVP